MESLYIVVAKVRNFNVTSTIMKSFETTNEIALWLMQDVLKKYLDYKVEKIIEVNERGGMIEYELTFDKRFRLVPKDA